MYKYVILLFIVTIKSYSQNNEVRTVFDKDSLHSISTYIGVYNRIVDSLVIKTKNKKLKITQKNVVLFYNDNINEDLGICPYALKIENLNKRFLYVNAVLINNFTTSIYFFLIDKKKYELVETYLVESAKKAVTPYVLKKGKKILIPLEENFILNDTIKILNSKKKVQKITIPDCKRKYLKIKQDRLYKDSCIKLPFKL